MKIDKFQIVSEFFGLGGISKKTIEQCLWLVVEAVGTFYRKDNFKIKTHIFSIKSNGQLLDLMYHNPIKLDFLGDFADKLFKTLKPTPALIILSTSSDLQLDKLEGIETKDMDKTAIWVAAFTPNKFEDVLVQTIMKNKKFGPVLEFKKD